MDFEQINLLLLKAFWKLIKYDISARASVKSKLKYVQSILYYFRDLQRARELGLTDEDMTKIISMTMEEFNVRKYLYFVVLFGKINYGKILFRTTVQGNIVQMSR